METLKIIFTVILEMSIVSSIIGIITVILRKILKYKIPPKYLILLWSVFLVTLINPIRFQSDFSVYNLLENKIIFNNNQIIVNEALDKHTNISEFNETAKINDNKNMVEEKIKNKSKIENIIEILTIVYFISILVNSLLFLHISIKVKRKTQYLLENKRLGLILEKVKRKMDINKKIKIINQDLFVTPAIYGVISPKILLNKNILDLSDNEIELILYHELLHMKNGDTIINKILQILKIIYCFNPIINFLLNRVKKDIELANDENVLEKIESEKVNLYCKTLLKISLNSNKKVCRALGMASRPSDLEERIIMIKENNKFFKNKFIIVSIVLILILGITVCFATEKSQSINEVLYEIKEEKNLNSTSLRDTALPVEGKIVITSTYGKRLHPIKGEYMYHSGIDILAKTGDSIMAIASGKVESCGFDAENGNYVEIMHFDEETEEVQYSFYAHLSKIDVETGEVVKKGEKIGEAGSTGFATWPHLHLEIRDSLKNAIDPANFLKID